VIIARPQTFMNLSGQAVLLLKQFYKIPVEDIWVIYDDIDLPLGTIRIREDGSAGTHNGMKSIIQTLSTESFPRFRLGIESRGEGASSHQNLSSFVLEAFRNEELPQVNEMVGKCVDALVLTLKKSLEDAKMSFSH